MLVAKWSLFSSTVTFYEIFLPFPLLYNFFLQENLFDYLMAEYKNRPMTSMDRDYPDTGLEKNTCTVDYRRAAYIK